MLLKWLAEALEMREKIILHFSENEKILKISIFGH